MVRTLRCMLPALLVLAALAAAPPAHAATLFDNGFEAGSFSGWNVVQRWGTGAAWVQGDVVRSGTYAARLSSTADAGSAAFVRQWLPSAQTQLTVAADVRILGDGPSGNVPLLRLQDPNGGRVVSLQRQNADYDRVWVQHSGSYHRTSATFPLHAWGRFELSVRIAGGASTVVAKLNGAVIYSTTAAALGTAGVQALQLGNEETAQPFALVADGVLATTESEEEEEASGPCNPAAPTPWTSDPGAVVVADNFESGLGRWAVTQQGDASVTTQSQFVRSGGCAARTTVTANDGSLANLTKTLPWGTRSIWADGWFAFLKQGASDSWNAPTFRIFADGRRVLDVSRQNVHGTLFVRYPNGYGGWTIRSTGRYPALGRWYRLKLHAWANYGQSTVEVWLDGERIYSTTAATLGTARLSMQMIGAEHARQEGVVAVDDVVVKASP